MDALSLIKDVAARAGVSSATVSLVMNGKPGISEETRLAVQQAARELGYTPPRMARRAARLQHVRSVQFIVYRKHGRVVGDTPFFSSLLEGAEKQARQSGLNLLIAYSSGPAEAEAQLRRAQETGCCGLLVLATEMEKDDLAPFLASGIPLVVVDNAFADVPVDAIVMDNAQGDRDAVQLLVQRGFTQIGHLRSSTQIHNFVRRRSGYREALQQAGLPQDPAQEYEIGSTPESAYTDMKALLRKGRPLPQAFFADNDILALGALRALREAGYRVPQDVSLIGFDDIPMCELSDPPLSTVRVEKEYIGRLAVERLVCRLDEPDQPAVCIQVRTAVAARGSVGRAAGKEENHDL